MNSELWFLWKPNIFINYIFLLWMLVSVGGATSEEEKFEIKLTPSNKVERYEKDSYIVTCQVLHGKTRLRWLNPEGIWVENLRGRIHVKENDNEVSLVFTSISVEDKGDWTCEAEEGGKKISFNMIVIKGITFGTGMQVIQNVKENEDVLIKCEAFGDPEPSITWNYNGQPINLDAAKYKKTEDGLLIREVYKNDSGEYTCKAFQMSSSGGDMKEHTTRLNIMHKPVSPIRRESIDVQYGYIKGYVNVTCEAEAAPPAVFRWYRNNKDLNSQHHQIINSEHISILQLYLNDSNQFGDYVCEANNDLGSLRRTIMLINGTKPNAPPHLTLRGVNSNTFDLDVGAKRKLGPPDPMDIKGYRFELISTEEHRNNGGNWTNALVVQKDFTEGVTYLINNLSPNTTYWIRVASRNAAGLSDWMGPKEFRTHAKAFGTHTSVPGAATIQSSCQNIAMRAIHLLMFYIAYDIYIRNGWN